MNLIRSMNESALALVLHAAAFAAHAHRDQRRKNPEASPYINHPISLAYVLAREAGIEDTTVLCAALLHDTVEDTEATLDDLKATFGDEVAAVVDEVTDDKLLPKNERKQLQIKHAANLSTHAKLVKLADKICNLRDITTSAPDGWSMDRQRQYFEWAKQVIDEVRGVHPKLEALFDIEYAKKP